VSAFAIAALAEVAAAACSFVVSIRNETVARSGARTTLAWPLTVSVGMRRLLVVCAFAAALEPAVIAHAASAARMRCFMSLQRKRPYNRAGFSASFRGKGFLQEAALCRGFLKGERSSWGF
jgi:hypothetical protein